MQVKHALIALASAVGLIGVLKGMDDTQQTTAEGYTYSPSQNTISCTEGIVNYAFNFNSKMLQESPTVTIGGIYARPPTVAFEHVSGAAKDKLAVAQRLNDSIVKTKTMKPAK